MKMPKYKIESLKSRPIENKPQVLRPSYLNLLNSYI